MIKIRHCKKINLFYLFLIFLSLAVIYLTSIKKAIANMSSSNYELQMPNLNFSSGNVSSDNYKIGFTAGQLSPGKYNSEGFRALVGFWYLKTIIPFSFSISNNVVDFGDLSFGEPQTAATTIVVSAGGAGGYQVTVEENHQLLVPSIGAMILDTTGDEGDISENNAGLWANNTTYGFGYTMYGDDVPSPFPSSGPAGNYYKQFADISKGEIPQIIMSSDKVGVNRTATLTYKVNISPMQAAGRYHNVITYIATPTY